MTTPFPWRINKQANTIDGAEGQFVCSLKGVRPADAAVMVAGPEMREALQDAANVFDALASALARREPGLAISLRGDAKRARAALAKADVT